MDNTTTPTAETEAPEVTDVAEVTEVTEVTEVAEVVSSPAAVQPFGEQPDELLDLDEDDDGEENAGSGVVSGAFGLTSLVLSLVGLTGGWLGAAYQTRLSLQDQVKGVTTAQQQLDMYASMWREQALFGGIFALAALLLGAGVLTAPSLLLSGKLPGWARGAALGGVILAVIGLIIAILTWYGVLVHPITAPPSTATPSS